MEAISDEGQPKQDITLRQLTWKLKKNRLGLLVEAVFFKVGTKIISIYRYGNRIDFATESINRVQSLKKELCSSSMRYAYKLILLFVPETGFFLWLASRAFSLALSITSSLFLPLIVFCLPDFREEIFPCLLKLNPELLWFDICVN